MYNEGDWQIWPVMAARITGFPIEYLHQLRYPRSAHLASTLLKCEAEIDALRQSLLTVEFPQAVARARQHNEEAGVLVNLSAWRHAVGRGSAIGVPAETECSLQGLQQQLCRWNTLLSTYQQLSESLHQAWMAEHAAKRRVLRSLVEQDRVQEAIYLSNPNVYASLQRYLRKDSCAENSATRKLERRLVAYLQRFCSKNETQSFFGPINYATLLTDQQEALSLRLASTAIRQRRAFPSQWMAEALAAAISAEPELRPFLRPRQAVHCLLRADHTLVFPLSGAKRVLDAPLAWLFEHCDGQHSVRDLARQAQKDCTTTWQYLEQLQQWGAVVLHILIPGETSDPLASLQDWLAALPENAVSARWQRVLSQLQTCVETFATTPFPQRVQILEQMEENFVSACGQNARRSTGGMYVDRALLFEECLGNLEQCTLGGTLAHQLTHTLQPLLNLWYTYGYMQMRRDQTIAHRLWRRLLPRYGQSVPFLAYLRAAQHEIKQAASPECVPNESEALLRQLCALVSARSDGHVARLSSTELPQVPPGHAYTSPDVMIAAKDIDSLQQGDYQIILGEGHAQPLLLVFPTAYFLDQEQRACLKLAISERVFAPNGEAKEAQILVTRSNKIFPYPLADAQIELRPFYPDGRAIPVAAVEVCEQVGSLVLKAQGCSLCLHPPLKRLSEHFDPLAPFAFPAVRPPLIELGEHTPRIEIDGIVCQRERWVLPSAPIQTQERKGSELFLHIWRWKERYGLPQEVFVRAPHEPKPVYIDFCNYLLTELLAHLAGGCEFLIVSEMLPHSQQLWLKQDDGHHSCELRIMAVR